MEQTNRKVYAVSEAIDKNAFAPVARGYQSITPSWWRTAVGNVFANLRGIDSAVNGFLQGKPKSGSTDLARVLVNTTLGLGGIFDPASRANLRYQDEDFGQTLAVWGVKRTRYVYVPLLGPSTVRDAPSLVIRGMLPRWILGSHYEIWMGGLDAVNARAAALTLTDARDASAIDPYAFTRDAYYQRRKFQIYDGDPPMDDFFDEFDDEEFDDEEFDAEELSDDLDGEFDAHRGEDPDAEVGDMLDDRIDQPAEPTASDAAGRDTVRERHVVLARQSTRLRIGNK